MELIKWPLKVDTRWLYLTKRPENANIIRNRTKLVKSPWAKCKAQNNYLLIWFRCVWVAQSRHYPGYRSSKPGLHHICSPMSSLIQMALECFLPIHTVLQCSPAFTKRAFHSNQKLLQSKQSIQKFWEGFQNRGHVWLEASNFTGSGKHWFIVIQEVTEKFTKSMQATVVLCV